MTAKPVLISAGEASSEMYAARLAAALRARTGATLFGMGGPRMAEAGVELIADFHQVAVVGLSEVVHKIPTVIRVQRQLASEAIRRQAALAILVDSPSTHFGVARRVKRNGIPVGYFIGPQVWAWRAGRMRMIKRLVDRMVVIFPFEEKIYRAAGVPVDFVGHPLVDVVRASMTRQEFAARYGLDAGRPIVTLLPGSRRSEIGQHYPRILDACSRLTAGPEKIDGVQFVLAAAPGLGADFFARQATRPGVGVTRVEGATYDALAAADCAIVASGTATVEAALLCTPMVIVYRVSGVSALILRRMIRTPFIGMVNLIASKQVAAEFVQEKFTSAAVAHQVSRLLGSQAARDEMKTELGKVRARLGPGGAIDRAADIFARMM